MTARHTHVDLKHGYSVKGQPKPPYGVIPTHFDAHDVDSLSIAGKLVAGERPAGAITSNYDWIDTDEPIRVAGEPIT